jgi:hypothetical protein
MKRSKYLQTQYLSEEELKQYDDEIARYNRIVWIHYIRAAVIAIFLSLVGGYIVTLIN